VECRFDQGINGRNAASGGKKENTAEGCNVFRQVKKTRGAGSVKNIPGPGLIN